MALKFDINTDKIVEEFSKDSEKLKKAIEDAAGNLAAATHAKAVELASNKLSEGMYKKFTDNLSYSKIEDGVWVVTLKADAVWLDDGIPPYSMYDTHLKSPKAKTSEKGYKYLTIPFNHSKSPSSQSAREKQLASQIKDEFKARGIPWKKIETNPDGSPRLGLLHKFNIASDKPSSKAKDPALKGVSVYQREIGGKTQRDVMTFRVISEKTKGDGRWQHPGKEGSHIFDDVYNWLVSTWDNEILPSLINNIK